MICAHCVNSVYRTENTMTCTYGVAPVIKLRSDTCECFMREIGADDEGEANVEM